MHGFAPQPPNLQAAVLGLARACYGKWFAQPTAENRQAAVAAIRSAIDLFPAEQELYQLLKTIQLPPATPTTPKKDTPQKAWALIAVLLVTVLLAVTVVFVTRQPSPVPVESLRSSTSMPSTSAVEVPVQVEEAPTPAPKSGVSKKETPPTTTAEPTPQIGVVFNESSRKILDFQLENSDLGLYPGSYAYKLTGYFQVKNAEIEKLKIRIE